MVGQTRGGAVRLLLIPAIFAYCSAEAPRAAAQGAQDYPIPSSAGEAYSPIREGFTVPLEPRDELRGPHHKEDPRGLRLRDERDARWPNMPVFFRDTYLRANSRTYWFDEHDFGYDDPKAFTTGGSLAYESGYLADFFQLRGVLYTSQPLYANATAGQSRNLTEGGDQITTLGQINGRVKFAGQQITAGRQLVRTPFINPYDVRMIPLTFEGVVLVPEDRGDDPTFDYIASYLTQYKPRDDDNFIPFSEGLGVAQDEGVLITGASYHANGWNIGATNYWINDVLNTAYGEIDYLFPFGNGENTVTKRNDGPSLRVGVNYLDQRTVGSELIAGAPYETYQASARLMASYRGFVLTGAVSTVGDEASIQKPFGFSTSYTAMMVTDFHQAGVDAYLLRLSYNLGEIGLNGVKFEAAWGQGYGQLDPVTNGDFANQDELDLRIVYEPEEGRLRGLRVEVEYIDWQVLDPALPSDELSQFRTIVNYAVPLL